jgi:integrase/recombinase XerD
LPGKCNEGEEKEADMQEQIDRFLANKENRANTVAAYHNDLSQFYAYVRDRRREGVPSTWRDISTDDLIDYVLDLKQREYAVASVARKIAAVKSFFHYLMDVQVISSDPSVLIDSPHVKKVPPQIMDQAVIDRLLAAPAQASHPKALRDRALLELLYATGMRVSEIAALNVADVNLNDSAVACEHDNRHPRAVRLNERAVSALADYLANGRQRLASKIEREEALFINHRGQRLTRQGLWLIVKSYADQLGITVDVTPHILRHSSAMHRLASGEADVQEVQHALGHASRATTLIYADLAARQAADRMDENQ